MRRDVSKGLIYALLATSLALLGLVILAVLEPGSSQLAARPHAAIESMLSSGAAAPGGTGTLWAGFATGILVIVMIGRNPYETNNFTPFNARSNDRSPRIGSFSSGVGPSIETRNSNE